MSSGEMKMNVEPQRLMALSLEEFNGWRKDLDMSDMYVTKPELREAFAPYMDRIRDLSLRLGRPTPTPNNTDAFFEFARELGHEFALFVCPKFHFVDGACIIAAMLLGRELTE